MQIFNNKHLRWFAAVAVILLAGAMSSCGGDSDSVPSTVEWTTSPEVSNSAGNMTLRIGGAPGTQWTAEVFEGSEWCKFAQNATTKSGVIESDFNIEYLYYTANSSTEARTAKVRFTFNGADSFVCEFTQAAGSGGGVGPVDPNEKRAWAELPAYVADPAYQYVSHFTDINSKQYRNYSMCYDKEKFIALWVAYPMHNIYLGGQSRTDDWEYDPSIATQYQPNLKGSYEGNWDRGHQLPSGDRTANYLTNAQTFYYSNMTPQFNRLNQDMWRLLEDHNSDRRCADTLYVVTGVHFDHMNDFTYDDAGKRVPIPTHYYRVLLRSKSGDTGKAISELGADELISIGFWVEHRSYGVIAPPREVITSVSEIEQLTGFRFFTHLNQDIAATVKGQDNPSAWGL